MISTPLFWHPFSKPLTFHLLLLLLLHNIPQLVTASSWTSLPNVRCHNSINEFHNVASLSACESLCDRYPDHCSVVSFCPPTGGEGCPYTSGCWLFPLSVLNTSCDTTGATGWVSAQRDGPPPPSAPPADWAARIGAGHMAFTLASPEEIGVGFFPVVGNGFIGFEVGPFVQVFTNSWPWRDAGSLKLSGVYSGYNYSSPSHRAQIPRLSGMVLQEGPGDSYSPVGAAIDYEWGVYYNRTRVTGPSCPTPMIVETRTYAHRALRELFVFEVAAFPETQGGGWSECTVDVAWDLPLNPLPDTILTETRDATLPYVVRMGTTALPEEVGLPLRSLAIVFDSWVSSSLTTLTFTPGNDTLTLRAVLRSDLDVGGGGGGAPVSPTVVGDAAVATWKSYSKEFYPSAGLMQLHMDTWAELWGSGGLELSGNDTLAAVLNASAYDIVSSLRDGWNWSTSPGGLATGGYSGHSFWDMETWMYPVLAVLYPKLARVASQYRIDRVAASEANAASLNETGAHFAWESAYTGLWASPWRGADYSEIHLDADIPLAQRKYYYASGDDDFLEQVWPLLNATCRFWECRFTRVDSVGTAPPPGYPSGCGAKDGVGNWTVRQVITPDESSGIISDSAYTNAAAGETLAWCLEAANYLGIPPSSLPPLWRDISAAIYLPLNSTLYPVGPVHPQQTGYSGKTINQADVALLQYPLGLDFGAEQNQRDLDYYTQRTDFSGMFTGDSSYACAYLALGNRSAADSQLGLAFGHISTDFKVFTETEITFSTPPSTGGTQHFITGSGGLLQAFVFGYPGLRIARKGVLTFTSQRPILPPLGVTGVKLRGLHLLGQALDVWYDAVVVCGQLQGAPTAMGIIEIRTTLTPTQVFILNSTSPACFPVQPFEVAGAGYM